MDYLDKSPELDVLAAADAAVAAAMHSRMSQVTHVIACRSRSQCAGYENEEDWQELAQNYLVDDCLKLKIQYKVLLL